MRFQNKIATALQVLIATTFTIAAPLLRAQDTRSEHNRYVVPDEFIGTFSTLVPEKIGQDVPTTKAMLQCTQLAGCKFSLGAHAPAVFANVTAAKTIDYARESLAYAQAHRDQKPGSFQAARAKFLMPLLASAAEITSCIDLRNSGPNDQIPGAVIFCRIRNNPWPKDVVLLMGFTYREHDPLFSSYDILPLFHE